MLSEMKTGDRVCLAKERTKETGFAKHKKRRRKKAKSSSAAEAG